MKKITQVAESMQKVLGENADKAAREKGFVKRTSKITGAVFVQTLVLGWLAKPEASLEELTQTAAALGVKITPQGLDQRFSKQGAECLEQVLQEAVKEAISADEVAVEILKRFRGVYIFDSSTISLPDELKQLWTGCGGDGPSAALKLQVGMDLSTGAINGPILQEGKANDANWQKTLTLPAGSLRIADLGYFDLGQFASMDKEGVYWLSRVQPNTGIRDECGQYTQIVDFLQHQKANKVEMRVLLGAKEKLNSRLLAVRVPKEVAEKRRRNLRRNAAKKGSQPGQKAMAMADWTVFVTNATVELLSLDEALVLARARWQIELLFKLWKSQGLIDEWRSNKVWRIMCEVYAKLIAMLIQHWILITSCWAYPNRSLSKAALTVQKMALTLASIFGSTSRICSTLSTIALCLSSGCRINKRKSKPNTFQLLLDLHNLNFS